MGSVPSEKEVPKLIVVVGPHTSFMDFPIGLFVRMQQGRDIKYLAKNSLFKFPLGVFLKWLGGYPVDRSSNKGLVDSIIDMFEKRSHFAICITPEGTRKRVERLKSGFYHIARGGDIPVQMVGLDFGRKTVFISKPLMVSASWNKEMDKIREFWKGMKAYHPEKAFH